MAPCFLIKLPYDILLLISGLLQSEDSLRFIQTCKTLYALTGVKAFWLACGKALEQRRQLHPSAIEELDISQLRAAIIRALKLELKWSGCEGIDPSPLKCTILDSAAHATGVSEEDKGITWVWFLHDGVHLTCVVADVVVQLWHIPTNRLILNFEIGGTLMQASQKATPNYWILAASIGIDTDTDTDTESCNFRVWKYRWDTAQFSNSLLPIVSLPVQGRASFVFVADRVAGIAYITMEPVVGPKNDQYGCLAFQTVDWMEDHKTLRRFTPLSYFGPAHIQESMDDLSLFERTASVLIVGFDSLVCATMYAYEMRLFTDFSSDSDNPSQIIYPRAKCEYSLDPADSARWVSEAPRLEWSQSGLSWNNSRMGILSFHHGESWMTNSLSISTLSLSSLLVENTSNNTLQGEYRRCLVDTETGDYSYYRSERDWRFVGGIGVGGMSNIWVTCRPEQAYVVRGIVIARLLSLGHPHASPELKEEGAVLLTTESVSTASSDIDSMPDKTVVRINLDSWIPETEQAGDVDIDDRCGRVVIGTESGKIFLFEFV